MSRRGPKRFKPKKYPELTPDCATWIVPTKNTPKKPKLVYQGKLKKVSKEVGDIFKGLPNVVREYVSELKSKLTQAEIHFSKLINKTNLKHVKQYPIKNHISFYIIDFYIPAYNLCIEVDGGYHSTPEQVEKDKVRDRFLKSKSYNVCRITNEELFSIHSAERLKKRLNI